jgi:hypothetical protein
MLYYFIQVKKDVIALIFNPTRERCAYWRLSSLRLKVILISIDKKGGKNKRTQRKHIKSQNNKERPLLFLLLIASDL